MPQECARRNEKLVWAFSVKGRPSGCRAGAGNLCIAPVGPGWGECSSGQTVGAKRDNLVDVETRRAKQKPAR
jgi:hypothetical protein